MFDKILIEYITLKIQKKSTAICFYMQENGKMLSEFVKRFCLIKYMSVEFFNNFLWSLIGILDMLGWLNFRLILKWLNPTSKHIYFRLHLSFIIFMPLPFSEEYFYEISKRNLVISARKWHFKNFTSHEV